jgi:hypothetical protein
MPDEDVNEVVHPAPAWRDRADFIIGASIADSSGPQTEQLWARRIGDLFEICCIPFFVYDVALGDVVEADESLALVRVVEPSGRYVFRVWFGDAHEHRPPVADQLTALGCLMEWRSHHLLAIDARDQAHAQRVADYLGEVESTSAVKFETGRR